MADAEGRRDGVAERIVSVVALGAVLFIALAMTGTLPLRSPGEAGATQYCTQYDGNPGCQPLVPPLIAFQSNRDGGGGAEIYAMNADGSAQTRLYQNASVFDGVPSWSPDGQKVAFESDRDGNAEIYSMNVDGSGSLRLTNNTATDTVPAWSPDGSKIAFESARSGNLQVYVMNADGSNLVRLTNDGGSIFDGVPAWSPDGSKIAFASSRASPLVQIWVMNADGTDATRLTTDSASDTEPAWSPDGAKIAFVSNASGVNQIYVMNANGSGVTQLTTGTAITSWPTWSPDGSKIAFSRQVGTGFDIFVMNADGSGVTQLTNAAGGSDTKPSWQAGPPGAPTAVTATPGATKASVSFTAPVQLGGASIVRYTVTASPGGIQATGSSSPIVVHGLSNGTSYTFKVTASNPAGTGPPSADSNAVTPAPLDLSATYLNANNSVYVPGTWTNMSVTVTFFCTDVGGPGVASVSPPVTVSAEGKQTLTATCSDETGTTITQTFGPIWVDRTLPLLTATVTNANGTPYVPGTWTNQNVNIVFSCTDPGGSGIASLTAPVTVTTTGGGQFRPGLCTDNAGNVAQLSIGPVQIDKTLPTVTATYKNADGTPYTPNTWTRQNVVVTFGCTDAGGSGVASISAPVTVTTEGKNSQATGTCTDKAGNTASRIFSSIEIDRTPPVLTATLRNEFSFTIYVPGTLTNQPVIVQYACTDGSGSGVTSVPFPKVLTGDGTNQFATATCTDIAGNSTTQSFGPIDIDGTPPVLSATYKTADGLPYVPGTWTNQAVTVSFSCTDPGGSGVQSFSAPVTIATEGPFQAAIGSCTDVAGNVQQQQFGPIDIDLTPPDLTALFSSDWTNRPVTVTFVCEDGLSGPASWSAPVTVSTEGGGQFVSGSCVDIAGNVTMRSFGPINIDLTPPVVSATFKNADGSPYVPGSWTAQAVTVTFACADTGGSGPGSLSAPVTLYTDGAGQTATGTCTDVAGNSTRKSFGPIDIDRTPPVLAASYRNANGSAYIPGTWTNQSVTVTFSCTDTGGSGVASFSAPVTLSSQGANQTAAGSCTDNVGNVASQAFGPIHIDKTAPEAYLVFDPPTGTLLVYGTDTGGSGVGSGPIQPGAAAAAAPRAANQQTYRVIDGAGNTLVLVLSLDLHKGDAHASFVSLSYNGGTTTAAPANDLHYTWDTTKDGSLKSLTQDLHLGSGKNAQHLTATYISNKNQTTIKLDPGQSSKVSGLVLVKVVTSSGTLAFQY